MPVFAWKGRADEEFWWCIEQTLFAFEDGEGLNLILDDGGDLTSIVLDNHPDIENILGLSEETTTGVHRLYERARKGTLPIPAINVTIRSRSQSLIISGCQESLVDALRRGISCLREKQP